ncbi:recombinase family protein [Microbacterium sp. Root280D1]|uniref:recombinase family protein n=1 Tax=Microbacterium sp. Root280D1 TaxID=1736510 RepID=UPI0009E75F05
MTSTSSRTFGLARVSTNGQQIERQLDSLKAAGCLDEDIIVERGVSGASAERPALDELRLRLRDGDTLVIPELSRLGRRTAAVVSLVDELVGRGVILRCLEPGLVFDGSPVSNLLLSVLAAAATLERDLLVPRTIDGLNAARERGRVGGRPARLTDVQRREVVRMSGQGRSYAELAAVFRCSERTIRRAVSGKR